MDIRSFASHAAQTVAHGIGAVLALAAAAALGAALAQTPAAPPTATPEAIPAPATPAPAVPSLPETDQKASPGLPGDSTVETVDVPARPAALIVGDAQWVDGFKSIQTAIAKVEAAVRAAGLKKAGPPFAVFLSTDDASFHFEAMIPLAARPEGKSDLADGVKLGDSPYGRALKFLHRGAYDDIDSTYDLITAYLDEKGLDSKNLFIEEYLTPTKESDDAGLEADIYVFVK